MKRLLLIAFMAPLFFGHTSAQSSEGTTFWLAYMENIDLIFNDDPVFAVVLHAEQEATGEIQIPVTGFSIPFTVGAGETEEVELPPALYYIQGSDITGNTGIRIVSDAPIRATGVHYRAYFSEATHLLPEPELGTDYFPICYADDVGDDPSSFVVLSTEDETEIEITPSVLTLGLRPPGVPFTITLNAGQIYQVQAVGDLTGSRVRSVSGQPVAVFSGAKQADIIDCGQGADSHVYDQAVPVDKWGALYYHTPFQNQGAQVVRILASEDNTKVFVDCDQVATLDQGEYYTVYDETYLSGRVISASRPVAVAQFITNGGCSSPGSGLGDPNMLWLWPADYKTREARFKSLDRFNELVGDASFTQHSVNIVANADEVDNILLDGAPLPAGAWMGYLGDPSKVYRKISLGPGEHILSSPELFQAYVYGRGFADAYTYFAGYTEVEEEAYACLDIQVEGVFCVDSTLNWSYQTSLDVTDVNWDFGDGQTSGEDNPAMSYGDIGSSTVVLTLTTSTGTFTDTLEVSIQLCDEAPCPDDLILSIQAPAEVCANSPAQLGIDFEGQAVSATWDLGGVGQTSDLNPQVNFNESGTYTITVTVRDELNCEYTATAILEVLDCGGCGPELVDLEFEGFACVDSVLVFPLAEFLINDPPLEVTWTVDGQTFENLSALEYAFPAPGTYTVTFQAISLQGCSYIGQNEVQIQDCSDNPCIGQPPLFIVAPDQYCLQQPLAFTAQTTADLVSFSWEATNGDTGEQPSFTTTFNEAGVGTVFLQAIDVNGCVYFAAIEDDLVDCGDDPCQDLPELAIEVGGVLCRDSALAFSVPGVDLTNYNWQFSNLTSSTEPEPTSVFQETGLFTAALTAVDEEGCTRTGSTSFTIEACDTLDPCLGKPQLEIIGDTLVCLGGPASFSATGPDDIAVYDWNLDAAGRSDVPAPTADYDAPGLYSVVLLAVDEEGCTFSDNFSFEVAFCEPPEGCAYTFPNAFSPNGDGTNDTFKLLSNCPVGNYNLKVFNRWGGIVFESDDADAGWDGRFNGKAAPVEVYYYLSSVETATGDIIQLNGDLTLLR